ncbi:hypothetical protein Tco_0935039 [Tanacetum coccineum]
MTGGSGDDTGGDYPLRLRHVAAAGHSSLPRVILTPLHLQVQKNDPESHVSLSDWRKGVYYSWQLRGTRLGDQEAMIANHLR